MARRLRVDVGGVVYHVLNRRVGRMTLFAKEKDYADFEQAPADGTPIIERGVSDRSIRGRLAAGNGRFVARVLPAKPPGSRHPKALWSILMHETAFSGGFCLQVCW